MAVSGKPLERHFAETAATLLGQKWALTDRERPDFSVSSESQSFGLEVTEIHLGPQGDGGSVIRAKEGMNHRKLEQLRHRYEQRANAIVWAKFLGDMSDTNLERALTALVDRNFPERDIGQTEVIPIGHGLKIWAHRALRPNWFCLNDRAGWVDQNPADKIQEAIRVKAARLPAYRQNAGAEVRLLVVANRILNSGKLELNEPSLIDFFGFSHVYFLSFPESITELKPKSSSPT